MIEHRRPLRPNQRRAIEAYLSSGRVDMAAAAAGVSRDSWYRWLREDAGFREALGAAESEVLRHLTTRLIGMGNHAVDAIEEILGDREAAKPTRLRAADLVLGRLLQLRELIDIEERLNVIEQRLNAGDDDAR